MVSWNFGWRWIVSISRKENKEEKGYTPIVEITNTNVNLIAQLIAILRKGSLNEHTLDAQKGEDVL